MVLAAIMADKSHEPMLPLTGVFGSTPAELFGATECSEEKYFIFFLLAYW